MPVQPTYPGVYIEEIPSGVHTITGVATSITAFVGVTKRGPVNDATQIFSFSDYQRSFGGLVANSDISYAISQFFLNGGTQAYVVRLAKNAKRAWLTLRDSQKNPVLYIWALDEGTAGNDIQVQIDQQNVIDSANFTITFSYSSADDPTDARTETYKNVSLDPQSTRYVVDMIHNISTLVDVSQTPTDLETNVPGLVAPPITVTMGPTSGSLTSSAFGANDLAPLPNAGSNSFQIQLDGDAAPTTVTIDSTTPFAGADLATRLQDAAARITAAVTALAAQAPFNRPAYQNFQCTADAAANTLVLKSGSARNPSVAIQAAAANDIATALHLAGKAANADGSLTSSAFVDSDLPPPLLDASSNSFKIGLDGDAPQAVTLDTSKPLKGTDLPTGLADIAGRIQSAVRALKPTPAYGFFKCAPDTTNTMLVLTSGSTGTSSQVTVAAGDANDIAQALHLLSGTSVPGTNPRLPSMLSPIGGSLTSGQFQATDLDALPGATSNSFQISLDGDAPSTATIDGGPFTGKDLEAKLQDAAQRIQQKVRKLKPASPAYSSFTCVPDLTKKTLVLTSGTIDPSTSSVVVTTAKTNDVAQALHLTPDVAKRSLASVPALAGGAGDAFDETDPDYTNIYLGTDDPLQTSGIYALEKTDLFNLLCLPGVRDGGILTAALEYCKQRRAFLIVDAPLGEDGKSRRPDDIRQLVTGPTLLPKADIGTYAAIYYPWAILPDPLKGGRLRTFPPSGIIAGLYARTDTARGVWKAPAGVDANLIGAQGLDYSLTDDINGTLNPHGINCLRSFPVYGIVCWGARTVSGDDQIASDYKYIPVRRLALFIEESLYRGTKWVVFEPNDEPLWAQIRLNVGAFMHNLFRQGAFQGQTPRDAYLVKCDSETTTQNDIDLGIVNILVGFAPLKPAEFVIIQIKQLTGQIQV